MQYKVPQKIDLEDKIIGPLTLKQFLYLLGGGIIIYLILSTYPKSIWVYLVIFLLALLSIAFAFVKIQEQDLAFVLFSIIKYLLRPRQRFWNKEVHIKKFVEIKKTKTEEKPEFVPKNPEKIKSRLEALSEIIDTHGWGKKQYQEEHLKDIEAQSFKQRVKSAEEARANINFDVGKKGTIEDIVDRIKEKIGGSRIKRQK